MEGRGLSELPQEVWLDVDAHLDLRLETYYVDKAGRRKRRVRFLCSARRIISLVNRRLHALFDPLVHRCARWPGIAHPPAKSTWIAQVTPDRSFMR